MIRKLRIKLIIASMLSLVIVLTVIFGTVGILNYRRIISDADSILFILKENDGTFPIVEPPLNSGPAEKDITEKGRDRFSPELPYESRYFSVFLNKDGTAISVNTGKIAAIDSSAAIEYAQAVFHKNKSEGFMQDYRYVAYDIGNETHIIFLDYGREMISFRSFLLTSGSVCLIGLLAVFLLLIFLSARIVKPFLKNYEKQKQFITDAGHELKTPLTIIDADSEVLEMDIGENEWLRDIRTQTKRLAQMTNSLILLSRMEEQPLTEKIDFPVSDVVEETVESFQVLAHTQNKTISCQITPMLSMYGSEKEIRQLVAILLDNAVKYSDETGKIYLSLSKQKNMIYLRVYNTAPLVLKEDLEHIFDRFYRIDKSHNSETGGYGLGLSIALAIVKAHRGKITASTQDEKSLLIEVTFPADS